MSLVFRDGFDYYLIPKPLMDEKAQRVASLAEVVDGRVCYWKDESGWWVYLPGCGAGMISRHAVEEHEDGTITVTPSVLMHGHRNGVPSSRHGYLRRGVWTEV